MIGLLYSDKETLLTFEKRVFSREVGSLVRGDLKKEEISLVFCTK